MSTWQGDPQVGAPGDQGQHLQPPRHQTVHTRGHSQKASVHPERWSESRHHLSCPECIPTRMRRPIKATRMIKDRQAGRVPTTQNVRPATQQVSDATGVLGSDIRWPGGLAGHHVRDPRRPFLGAVDGAAQVERRCGWIRPPMIDCRPATSDTHDSDAEHPRATSRNRRRAPPEPEHNELTRTRGGRPWRTTVRRQWKRAFSPRAPATPRSATDIDGSGAVVARNPAPPWPPNARPPRPRRVITARVESGRSRAASRSAESCDISARYRRPTCSACGTSVALSTGDTSGRVLPRQSTSRDAPRAPIAEIAPKYRVGASER